MNHGHVFTVASGFGLRVIPVAAPYRFTLGPEPFQLDTERAVHGTQLFARLTPEAKGFTSKIGADTPSLGDVLDVAPGPDFERWWLETSVYQLPLPRGWTALAHGDPEQVSLFDLTGPDGSLLFVQTPSVAPEPGGLCASGQRVHARGSDTRSTWAELRYTHDGCEWAQRHDIIDLGGLTCVVTVQARASTFPAIAETHAMVLSAIAPSSVDAP